MTTGKTTERRDKKPLPEPPPPPEPLPPSPPPSHPNAPVDIDHGFGWFERLLVEERKGLTSKSIYKQVVQTLEEGGVLMNLIWEAPTESKLITKS